MNSLRQIQIDMLNALKNKELGAKFAEKHICRKQRLAPIDSLAVYRNSITALLTNVLKETYPIVNRLVGDPFFNAMAPLYMREHPSNHHDLDQYGGYLSEFVANFPPASTLCYLSDVARLEWAKHYVSLGEPTQTMDHNRLIKRCQSEAEEVRLGLPKNTDLLSSDYPLLRIMNMHDDEGNEEATVDLGEGGVKLLVWRSSSVRIDPLTDSQWFILKQLKKRSSLAAVQQGLFDLNPKINFIEELIGIIKCGWIETVE